MASDRCVHELFEAQASRTPDSVAVSMGALSASYASLNGNANQLARHLQRLGAAPETLVALLVDRSIDAVTAMLAVLKTGAGYVIPDPTAPPVRIREVFEHCRPLLAVTTAELVGLVPGDGTPIVMLDGAAQLAADDRADLPCLSSPDNIAYVTYTSGSTGGPKGVAVTHRSITNGLAEVPFNVEDEHCVCSLNSPLSYGFSVAQLFLPLLSGVPVRIIPDDHVKDVRKFADALEAECISSVGMVTPLLRQLVAMGPATVAQLGGLRSITVGGAALTRELVAAVGERLPEARLKNGYAMSEAGGAVLVSEYGSGSVPELLSLGNPFPNTAVRVLDESRQPVRPGATGELCVAAPHLARGYFRAPGLTAARFVPDPGADTGARMFRSGDIGRALPGGAVEYLGRADDVVKIRGYRVALGEIEATLHENPQVREAVVTAHDGPQGPRLVAYVVPAGPQCDAASAKTYVASRLPDYMVPSLVVLMDALPVNASGKVDRAKLPAPEPVRPDLGRNYVEPQTPLQRTIAAIWAEALGLDRVGVHDDFLELGGDSLIATQIVARIWETFSTEVPFEVLFERPTVAALVEQCFPDDEPVKAAAV